MNYFHLLQDFSHAQCDDHLKKRDVFRTEQCRFVRLQYRSGHLQPLHNKQMVQVSRHFCLADTGRSGENREL